MKKKVALLLSIMMMINLLQGIPLYAIGDSLQNRAKYGLEQLSNKGIKLVDGKMKLVDNPEVDEVAMKWKIGDNASITQGKYTLEYDIEIERFEVLESIKVIADFYVGQRHDTSGNRVDDSKWIGVEVHVKNEREGDIELDYVQDYPKKDKPDTTKLFYYDLNLDEDKMDEVRELQVKVGGMGTIRLFVDTQKREMYFSTTGIQKDYIIPFSLTYEGNSGAQQSEGFNSFKGLSDLVISPTHLTEEPNITTNSSLSLPSRIEFDLDADMKGEKPGSRPGVVVTFNKFKYFDPNKKKFVFIDEATTPVKATLNLTQNFGNVKGEPISVDFDLKGNAVVKKSDGTDTGEVFAVPSTKIKPDGFEIYFVKDDTHLGVDKKDKVITWPSLAAGNVVEGELILSSNLFNTTGETIDLQVKEPGYTYVEYTVNRLSEEDIAFSIKPYQYKGAMKYTLEKANRPSTKFEPIGYKKYDTIPSGEEVIFSTGITFNGSYRMIMEPAGNTKFESQIVNYSGRNDPIPPPDSEIVSVDNIHVIEEEFYKDKTENNNGNKKAAAMEFDLTWQLPDKKTLNRYLEKGDIYYELYLSEEKGDTSDQIGELLKVFKLTNKNGTANIIDPIIESHKGKIENVSIIEDGTKVKATGVILKGKDNVGIPVLEMPLDYEDELTYPKKDEIKEDVEKFSNKIPQTYYLTVRAVYEESANTRLVVSPYSKPKPLVLDVTEMLVPTPQGLRSEQEKNSSPTTQILSFDNVKLQEYVETMLDPLDIYLYSKVKDALIDEKLKYSRTYEMFLYPVEYADHFDVNLQDGVITIKDGKKQIDLSDHRDTLRKGQLKIEYTETKDLQDSIDLEINGLDLNTPYYVQVRTRLDLYDEEGKRIEGDEKVEYVSLYSGLSEVHSFTTASKPVPPRPDEQVPPAPNSFTAIPASKTAVDLTWEAAKVEQQYKVYYELIRSDDIPRDPKSFGREATLEEINKDKQYKVFQRTDSLKIQDDEILPNRLYYYYIRTVAVKRVDGVETKEKVYSDWIMTNYTSNPVKEPTNLKVEPISAYKHNDPQHEVVISFYAPIPKDSSVPKDFDFKIALKGEKDTQFNEDYRQVFVERTTVDEENEKFVYRIKGLEHSTRYDIKVRIVDHTTTPSSFSGYSESVTARTDFSEEDQDQDNAHNEYLEIYDREADKLRRKSYWTVDSSKLGGIYKYRQAYTQAELPAFKSYDLVTKEEGRSVYYYLPSDFFEQATKAQTMVNITLEGYTATLRPSMIANNEEIEEARARIKTGKAEDFYIAVQFSLNSINGKINGSVAVSPEISIEMEIVYVDQEDLIIEDEILDELNDLIDSGRKSVVRNLEKEVKDGRIDEDRLEAIIDKAINWVQDEHEEEVYKILKHEIDRINSIYTIQKPIYIVAPLDLYEVSAYYEGSSSWGSVYTYQVGNGFAIEADRLGSYVFTGKEGAGQLLPDIPGGSSLISKYNLTDFFNIETGLDLTVTKANLYGSVARVMGARSGTDYIQYLKSRGVKLIIPNNLYQPVRQDEAIYIIMQAYEKMYYKNIETIYITNKLRVENIGAFQPQYRPYVYAAVELGVIKPEGNQVRPSLQITAKDVIRMLAKITPN